MSAYLVNKLCRLALHDLTLRDALKRDPEAAIAAWTFTDEERRALLAGDVAKLYELGANAFLLQYLTRWQIFGLSVPVYSERMRKARVRR